MPFAIRDLSVLAYANGFTLWHYKTGSDPSVAAAADNYFADAADMMTQGDIVMVSGTDGCRVIAIARADGQAVESAALG